MKTVKNNNAIFVTSSTSESRQILAPISCGDKEANVLVLDKSGHRVALILV